MISTVLLSIIMLIIVLYGAYFAVRTVTENLLKVIDSTEMIARGDFQTKAKVTSHDEVGILAHSVNTMAHRIESLLMEQVSKARQEKELETAKTVQKTFFPKEAGTNFPVHYLSHYSPASECGGDWWGHFNFGDRFQFYFIADATGHGAPAALVTAMIYAASHTISSWLEDLPDGTEPSPSVILQRINEVLYSAGEGSSTMTCFLGRIDLENKKMLFANAGHNPPLLIPKKVKDSRLSKGAQKRGFSPIKASGTPLGINPGSKYKDKEMDLKPGDIVFMFTDGIIENRSPEGQMWGKQAFYKLIKKTASKGYNALHTELLRQSTDFFADAERDDDVTMLTLSLDEEWGSKAKTEDDWLDDVADF